MSKRLSLSLSSNPTTGISASPKPSIFSSLLANKTNSNLRSTQNNNSPSNSGSRHATTPKKVFNLDAENDEIDLVNHTANDYDFSSSKSTKVQFKKNVSDKLPASGSSSTPNKPKETKEANNTRGEKSNETLTQNSSLSSSPTKSQPTRPLLSTPPASPIKIRKLESLSSDSFDEFDDTVKAKILESSDSEEDFDVPTPTSHVSNKVLESVESIDSSPLHSPKQRGSPAKSQVSAGSASSSQQTARPKHASQSVAKPVTPKKVVTAEEAAQKSRPIESANTRSTVQPESKSKDVVADKPQREAQQKEEATIPASTSIVTNRRLLQVAFDSSLDSTPKPISEPKPKTTNEEKPRPLSLFGNKSNAIMLNSDDDFVQPITKSSAKFSLKTSTKPANITTKKDVAKNEAKETKHKPNTASEGQKLASKKEETKQIQSPKTKPAPSKPAPKVGSKDVPLNIGSDSSFEVESPTKVKAIKETKVQQKEDAKNTSSQAPNFSFADLSRARSARIKRKDPSTNNNMPKVEKDLADQAAAVPTIRSKEVCLRFNVHW
jgi:hypothetical protein